MTYQVVIPKPVEKQLKALPQEIWQRITPRILALAEDPRPPGVKKLKASVNEYRIRIGAYRIRYNINDQERLVIILSCRHRKDIYRN
jgi:mRNA interferase RelE/StbE